MKKISTVFFLMIVTAFFSCQKKVAQEDDSKSTKDSVVVSRKKQISNIGERLSPKAKKIVTSWKEYQLFDELITRFYAISPAEALSNANELNTLATELNDSIRINSLKNPPMLARLHILKTECLRLKDMATISAIKDEAVSQKVTDILSAFSAVNAKINSIYAVDDLEGQLTLDPDFQMMIKEDSERTETDESILPPVKKQPKRVSTGKNTTPTKLALRKQKKMTDRKKQMLQEKLKKQKAFINPPKK